MDRRKHLLSLYDLFPFEFHPLWVAIQKNELTMDEVLRAETQHFIRTSAGRALRAKACSEAQALSPKIFESIVHTYIEECSDLKGPNHLTLIQRLLFENGVEENTLNRAKPTPGNSAAMALYSEVASRGAACHIIGAGAVEYFYAELSPKIFKAYTRLYGMTEYAAHTYKIHGPMDKEHAERAFTILDEAAELHGWDVIEQSAKDAFVATSLHYDGMLQAAKSSNEYWNGEHK